MNSINLLPSQKRREYAMFRWRKYLLVELLFIMAIAMTLFFYMSGRLYEIKNTYLTIEADYRLSAHLEKQLNELNTARLAINTRGLKLAELSAGRMSVYTQLVYVGINDFSAINLEKIEFSAVDKLLELSGTATQVKDVNNLVNKLSQEKIWHSVSLARIDRAENQPKQLSFIIRLIYADF